MPFFAWLGSLFASVAGFVAAWLTKKTAAGVALVTAYGVITVAMVAAVMTSLNAAQATVSGFSGLPSEVIVSMSYFTPDNLAFCLSLAITSRVQVSAYLWNVRNLKFMSQA